MNIYRISFIVFFIVLLFPITSHAIYPGESIDFDPATGDYMINYMGIADDGTRRMQHVGFVPATKIEPTVKSSFALGKDGAITYGYGIASGVKSRQPLILIMFDFAGQIKANRPLPRTWKELTSDESLLQELSIAGAAALSIPTDWDGEINPSPVGGHLVSWSYKNLVTINDGLQPGQRQGGFGFVSPDLPGMGVVELHGNSPTIGFPDEGPDGEIGNQHQKLQDNDFVTRPAAVPTVPVPSPFDAAVLLGGIQAQMHTWIAKQLLDPAFSAQLDRSFQSAISAYRLNQPKVGKQQIQAMRELIRKERPGADNGEDDSEGGNKTKPVLIDKLAARILDFDLNYVVKRMGGED